MHIQSVPLAVVTLALSFSAAHSADLIHRYSFTADADDSIGSADGTLEGGAVISGGAVVLDGSSAFVDLPNGLLAGLDDVTVEAWLIDNNSPTWARVFDFGNSDAGEGNAGTGTEYMFLSPQGGSGALRGAITIGGGEQLVEWPGTRLPAGVLVHTAWTYDSVAETGRLYVDGAPVDENTSMTIKPSDMGVTSNNWLGRSNWAADPFLDGSITEFRIYDGPLTEAEVEQNYNFGPDVLALSGPVSLILEPVSQVVDELDPVTFSVAYSGTPPVDVQWYRDSAPISGATNDTYTIASAALTDDQAVFHVVVSNTDQGNPYTDTSSNAVLTVVPDLTPPTLVRASSVFPDGVLVEFSEAVTAATATDISNYAITHAGGSLAVTGAAFGGDNATILLTTATQTLNTLYTLTVNNVRDLSAAANEIAPNSQTTFTAVPYVLDDIGSPAINGTLAAVAGGFDLTAGGSGIGGTSDQFSFSHKSYTGDFDVQVRVAGLDLSSEWARAGLMARDGLADDAVFAAVFATPGPAGCHFASRASVGAEVTMQGFFPVNYPDTWLRLRRTGDLFEGFAGLDGQTWQRLGSATIPMASSVEVGYALTSGEAGVSTSAEFRDEAVGSGTIVQSLALPFEPMGPCSRRTALVISEIMYDTPSQWGGTSSLEFVELWNAGMITEDLTGHRFSGEIDYTFPDGTTVEPGEFLVVAKDPAAAQSHYGVACLGPYTNKLANNGGTLRLRNELNGILLELEYDNRAPWPAAATGTGHSLVLRRPSYGENDARAWSASDVIGGSPGALDPYGAEPARGVLINEFLAHTDLPAVDYVELFNTGTQPVDISGAWLSDEAGTNRYRIADGTTILGREFLALDETQLGFALSADGEQIFLVNSNETRVLDAVNFRGQDNGVSSGRYPDGAPGFRELSTATQGSANTAPLLRSVVINEIMYHPISELNDDEYIEIYNRSGSPVDLSQWRIQGGASYEFPSNTVLAANGYLVVAENLTNLVATYPQLTTANTYGDFGGSLNNRSERIALSMPEAIVSTNAQGFVVTNVYYIVVDEVTYLDGGRWGQWSDGGGSSLELTDPDADNALAANWADSDESAKAAWTSIDLTDDLENGQTYSDQGSYIDDGDRFEFFLQGAGEVLVDNLEFRNNGGGNLVDNGNFGSGTSGWTLGGTLRNSYSEGGAGVGGSTALHVVSTARGDIGANKIVSQMNASVDTDPGSTGTIRASVRWLKGSPYILLRNSGHWIEVSQRLNVPTDCGTPGLPNSQLVANVGPSIVDVSHAPILPAASEAAVVSARVRDVDGLSSITLRYRLDPSSSYTSAAMNDSGTGGDAIAGDGLYSATIPGQGSGSLVAFYIEATDGAAANSQFPASAPARECLVRWGESIIPGSLGTYRIWLTSDNVTFWDNREKNANDPIDATFVYGNSRVVYNVDTLYSGSPFHSPIYNGPTGPTPCDYEVNFPPDDRFLGSEPFVLTAFDVGGGFFFQDLSGQVDLTGNWIARTLGQPFVTRRHIHVVVNGLRRGTIYDDAQQPNSEYLDMYFSRDDDGELRKVEDWFEFNDSQSDFGITTATMVRHDKAAGGIDPKRYRWNWRPRVTRDHDNWFAFTNLIAAVNDTGAADYEARVRTWMNVPGFLRPIVTHHICGSWDSYGYQRGKNMYAYKPDDTGWRTLMWDIELSMNYGGNSSSDSIYNIHDSVLSSLIQDNPAFHRVYLQGFQEAVDYALAPGVADVQLYERYGVFQQNGVPMASPSGIINWLASRRAYLQGVLPSAAFSVDGPTSFSVSSNSVVLTGTAPLQVDTILVNGIPYPVEWTGTTTWSLTIPLTAGANGLLLTGVDRFGDLYPGASASLTVTYTGIDPAPEDYVVFNEIHPSPEARSLQFVELHNTHPDYTFDLSNWRVNGLGYTFPAGSILPAQDHLLLVKDPFMMASIDPTLVMDGVYEGNLDTDGETLTLFRPGALPGEEMVVDRVRYEQAAPWSAAVNGSSLQLVDASRDNSRVANWISTADIPGGTPETVVGITDTWKYYQTGDPGASWMDPGFNDSGWPSGPALLYYESDGLPAPKNTQLTLGEITYYFRTAFTYTGSTVGVSLDLETVVDDSVIVYLNGEEIYRLGVDTGPVNHSTLANRVIGNAQYEGPFTIPTTALVYGQNLLAAEVHQQASDSSDVVFGLTLDVTAGGLTASSPGEPNSVATALPAFPDVWLNELQANNTSGPQDNFGEREPWVELYNAGPSAFPLDGYYLTDTYTNLLKWAFPGGASIPANGFTVVWCDAEPGETMGGALHTDFELGLGSGRVALTRFTNGAPQIVDYLNYTNLPSNWSYGDVPDGQPFYRTAMFFATPGDTNSNASAPITVFINEWLADNDGVLADPADGNYEDWFELYNAGTNAADLGGFYLTDDLTNDMFQFEIPNNGHYVIPPGGYLLVWADNESGQNSTNRPDLHVNFALSRNGESIGLFAANGTLIDAVSFGAQPTDVSEGRFPDGSAGIFSMPTPTPRYANQVANTAPSLDPIASRTLTLGQTLSFTASATDSDLPAQTLTYSLSGEPPGATIHATSGSFAWTPAEAHSTNTMAVVVTDNGTPNLNDTEWFTVVVVPPPVLGDLIVENPDISFSWPSVAGQPYQVYYKDDLYEVYWNPIGGVLIGTGDILGYTNELGSSPHRFFCIGLAD